MTQAVIASTVHVHRNGMGRLPDFPTEGELGTKLPGHGIISGNMSRNATKVYNGVTY